MLSQTVGYAIIALGYLADGGDRPILVRDIALATDIPPAYLSKIINTLAKKGLVVTQRGIKGGVILAREPDSINLYDLCVALDDPLTQRKCMLGTAVCSDERACPAHSFWNAHRERQFDFLPKPHSPTSPSSNPTNNAGSVPPATISPCGHERGWGAMKSVRRAESAERTKSQEKTAPPNLSAGIVVVDKRSAGFFFVPRRWAAWKSRKSGENRAKIRKKSDTPTVLVVLSNCSSRPMKSGTLGKTPVFSRAGDRAKQK